MLLFYILSLSIVSFSGVILNGYIMWKFGTSKKSPMSSFHKLCMLKTVPNVTITGIFAFWVVPLSILQTNLSDIPRVPNVIFGFLMGQYCYLLGPHIQVCMAVNRFVAIYFPFSKMKFSNFPFTSLAILGCLVLSSTAVVSSFFEHCFFVFDPPILSFHYDCRSFYASPIIFTTVVITGGLSNTINLLIFGKLVMDKVGGMNESQQSKRKKRSQRMYIQSVLQDILQVIDVLNFRFVAKIVDAFWWQFIFYCWFYAFIYVLDGMVMMYFNAEVNILNLFKNRVKTSNNVSVSGIKSTDAPTKQIVSLF